METRVVVTGIGLVTPIAATAGASWNRLIAGVSGIRKIPDSVCDVSDLATRIAGVIPGKEEQDGLNLDNFISPKDQHKMSRFIQHAIVASQEAIMDAGLEGLSEAEKNEVGVMIGSGIGGLDSIEANAIALKEKGPRRISPFFIPSSLINLASGFVSIRHGFKGPNSAVVTACSTGAHAIGDAAGIIARGGAKIMVAGGTEATVTRLAIAGFNACRALSTTFNDEPEKASRPWDKKRDGFVMGEGAGILILENYEHAKKRGAKIYAELLGYGMSGDAYHITSPSEDGDGGYRAMNAALRNANITPSQIDYINAHGTSTPAGDMVELKAVKRLFGEYSGQITMSSTKSSIGHLLGAAGSVEAIFSILAMRDGVIPPTLNLEDPEEDCRGVNLVPNEAQQKKKIDIVLSNSFGFGGTNASLVFGSLRRCRDMSI